jgi:hypothetical protein
MGYLKCNSCGGRYDLQPGELPGDFEDECTCGGKWEFYDDHGQKRLYTDTYTGARKESKKMSPLLKIIIILFVGYLFFAFLLRGIILLFYGSLYLGPYGIYLFPAIISIAIIGLIWAIFKRK